MEQDKMRDEFEAFHRKHMEKLGFDKCDIDSDFDRDDSGDYIYCTAADGWIYWQASRAAVVVELAPVVDTSQKANASRASAEGFNAGVAWCRAAIHAAGIRTK